jgi:hypothetical protein
MERRELKGKKKVEVFVRVRRRKVLGLAGRRLFPMAQHLIDCPVPLIDECVLQLLHAFSGWRATSPHSRKRRLVMGVVRNEFAIQGQTSGKKHGAVQWLTRYGLCSTRASKGSSCGWIRDQSTLASSLLPDIRNYKTGVSRLNKLIIG